MNVSIGYALSSEEQKPSALVDQAARAEAAGFEFASISDHFHPWLDVQGKSSFVWTGLGAIARATSKMRAVRALPVRSNAFTPRSSPKPPLQLPT